MNKENKDVMIVALVAITALIIISIIPRQTQIAPSYKREISAQEAYSEVINIDEENIAGMAFRLDECLQECQQNICKVNCEGNDGSLGSECYRTCLDNCNDKCLKVYDWI